MSDKEQTEAFAADLWKVVERYQAEFNLTLATAVGTLEVAKMHLYEEQTKEI